MSQLCMKSLLQHSVTLDCGWFACALLSELFHSAPACWSLISGGWQWQEEGAMTSAMSAVLTRIDCCRTGPSSKWAWQQAFEGTRPRQSSRQSLEGPPVHGP